MPRLRRIAGWCALAAPVIILGSFALIPFSAIMRSSGAEDFVIDILQYLLMTPIALFFFRAHRSFRSSLNTLTLLVGTTAMIAIVIIRIYGLLHSIAINAPSVLRFIHIATMAMGIWLVLVAALVRRSRLLPISLNRWGLAAGSAEMIAGVLAVNTDYGLLPEGIKGVLVAFGGITTIVGLIAYFVWSIKLGRRLLSSVESGPAKGIADA